MSRSIDDLVPEVALKAAKVIGIMVDFQIPHAVTSTLRTTEEQQALYAQGRKPLAEVNGLRAAAGMAPIAEADNGYTVTRADGVVNKSNHQGGRALDIVPTDDAGRPIWPPHDHPGWLRIAEIMRANGFKWGGDWPDFPDYPHYEMEA